MFLKATGYKQYAASVGMRGNVCEVIDVDSVADASPGVYQAELCCDDPRHQVLIAGTGRISLIACMPINGSNNKDDESGVEIHIDLHTTVTICSTTTSWSSVLNSTTMPPDRCWRINCIAL